MKNITRVEFCELLMGLRGATPVTITSKTEVRVPKSCQYHGTTKISKVNGLANFHYEAAVNRQLTREDKSADFEAMPRQWGERLVRPDGTLTPIVQHKGANYLELKVQNSLESKYVFNDKELDKDVITPFLPKSVSRQGTDKEVIVRDYKLESVLEATINGELYILK